MANYSVIEMFFSPEMFPWSLFGGLLYFVFFSTFMWNKYLVETLLNREDDEKEGEAS